MCGIRKTQSQHRVRVLHRKLNSSARGGKEVVGTTGFEPSTSRTPSVRATRLRYVPTAATRVEPHLNLARIGPHSTATSVSPAFKKRQGSAQRGAQIEQHFAAHKL